MPTSPIITDAYTTTTPPKTSFSAAYLGGPTMAIIGSNSTVNDKLGVQSFFTGRDSDRGAIYENNDITYNIYELRYNGDTYKTYNLTKITANADPNTATTALKVCVNTEQLGTNGLTYTCQQYQNDRNTALPYFASNGNYPITIQTPSLNERPTIKVITKFSNVTTYEVTPGRVYTAQELPQAYIVEASKSGGLCTAQQTVYGEKIYIGEIEGSGDYPYNIPPPLSSNKTSTGGWLLAGWDYSSNLQPSPGYPNIPAGNGLGPWVFVKLRRFSTTPNSF